MFQPRHRPAANRSHKMSLMSSIANSFGSRSPQAQVSYYPSTDLSALTAGLVQKTQGVCDGWPSNDVPLVVMYSTNMESLTKMRRLVQASGVRFLGYDRTNTLMDALLVLSPIIVLVDETNTAAAHRLGRQILAADFTYTLVRLCDEQALAPQSARVQERRKVVGAGHGERDGVDGPYAARLPSNLSAGVLIASFGRLGVLPRRLVKVR